MVLAACAAPGRARRPASGQAPQPPGQPLVVVMARTAAATRAAAVGRRTPCREATAARERAQEYSSRKDSRAGEAVGAAELFVGMTKEYPRACLGHTAKRVTPVSDTPLLSNTNDLRARVHQL